MNTSELLSGIDDEISRLQQVRALLAGSDGDVVRNGRARGPAAAFTFGANEPRKRHKMSAKAKAAIRAAQKKRWAEWHKTHPKR